MAKNAVNLDVIRQIADDVYECLLACEEIPMEVDYLDYLEAGYFEDEKDNEIGRKFLIGSYKQSLYEQVASLETKLSAVYGQLRKLAPKAE